MSFLPSHAPLYEALVAHAKRGVKPFHVPGHKQRAVWPAADAGFRYSGILELDVTELSDTDDLHHPQGPLAEAQRLAAECYGAEETSFLIGGSTAGNVGMILAATAPGELVVVQRNVHQSIINGLMLAGAKAVMLAPEHDPMSGLALTPSASSLEAALDRYRDAKAVILSTPNYYGMTRPIEPLVQIAHRYGLPVLVDEAHGPHFGFHPSFPSGALRAGADVVVHSTHKMLSSMTMGAMLHMQGALVDREEIRRALRMVQSSSPSFPILASIDLARSQLHERGKEAFTPALAAMDRFRSLTAHSSIQALGYGRYVQDGIHYDPLKIALFDETGALNGFELRDELERRNVVAEMADSRYAVLALGTGTSEQDGEALGEAVLDAARTAARCSQHVPKRLDEPPGRLSETIPEPISFGRRIGKSTAVALEQSIGRLAGEWVIPYPPGIPVLYPGETITAETIGQLEQWKLAGANIQGAKDSKLHSIQVLE